MVGVAGRGIGGEILREGLAVDRCARNFSTSPKWKFRKSYFAEALV